MDEYKVRHLPLVNGEDFRGLVYEEDLMEADEQAPMATLDARQVATAPNCHLYDLVAQWSTQRWMLCPWSIKETTLGASDASSILRFLAQETHWAAKGAVLVLEIPERDLSISEIARLVEGADTKVVACTTAHAPDSSNVEVTLKVQTEDVEKVIATFQRFGYTIQSFYMRQSSRKK